MGAQDLILGSRVAHVRELKTEIAALKSENAAMRDELGALRAHLDLALLALAELRDGGEVEIWDGWNLILGADRCARSKEELVEQAKASGRVIWIVFDGHDENVAIDGKVRVSYTGGKGEHRADKFVADFVRSAAYLGLAERVRVRTADVDFRKTARRLGAFLV